MAQSDTSEMEALLKKQREAFIAARPEGLGVRRDRVKRAIALLKDNGEALCKALFFGGVTRRFPKLRVAFLEGGVHWAVGLLGDLVGRWEKRNIEAVQRYDPKRIDRRLYAELFDAWAPIHDKLDHRYLNEVEGLDNPTSEVLARWIWDRLKAPLPSLTRVTVYETCESRCEYEGR